MLDLLVCRLAAFVMSRPIKSCRRTFKRGFPLDRFVQVLLNDLNRTAVAKVYLLSDVLRRSKQEIEL